MDLKGMFRLLFNSSKDPVVLVDDTRTILELNEALPGSWLKENVLGRSISQFLPPDFGLEEAWDRFLREGYFQGEINSVNPDGSSRPVKVTGFANVFQGKHLFIIEDLTGWKQAQEELAMRNRLDRILATTPDAGMCPAVLEVVLEFMKSPYGIFAYIDPEDGAYVPRAIVGNAREECPIQKSEFVLPREAWGDNIWSRSILEKTSLYSNQPEQLPKGHIPVQRVLLVPVLYGGEVIAHFEVANKASDYDDSDRRRLESIAQYIAPTLHARLERDEREKELLRAQENLKKALKHRQQMEELLRKSRDTLKRKVWERTKALEGAFRRLSSSELRLRKISTQLIQAQESERKLISQELHDSTISTLSSIKYLLEGKIKALQEGRESKILGLEKVPAAISKLILDLRRMMVHLRPTILDDLGLVPTIAWYCRDAQSYYPQFAIEPRISVSEDEIPEDLKIIVFRVMQEAVTNSIKYSKGSRITITLEKDGGKIRLRIEDDGIGFHLDEMDSEMLQKSGMGSGMGLNSMRDRVDLSNGEFRIYSHPGKGTVVIAEWAL